MRGFAYIAKRNPSGMRLRAGAEGILSRINGHDILYIGGTPQAR